MDILTKNTFTEKMGSKLKLIKKVQFWKRDLTIRYFLEIEDFFFKRRIL